MNSVTQTGSTASPACGTPASAALTGLTKHKVLASSGGEFVDLNGNVDELASVSHSPEDAQLFARFVSSRYERRSNPIAFDLEFAEWVQVFGDEKLTAAPLDRLTHRCHILLMSDESYRFRESLKRRQQEEQPVQAAQ